jgi:hypothetical protein
MSHQVVLLVAYVAEQACGLLLGWLEVCVCNTRCNSHDCVSTCLRVHHMHTCSESLCLDWLPAVLYCLSWFNYPHVQQQR